MELELKEEMDTFVVAVLTEYAKIFLQPNSKVNWASTVSFDCLYLAHRVGQIQCCGFFRGEKSTAFKIRYHLSKWWILPW